MAELLLSQGFAAGTKIIYMVETAKECADETVEMYGRSVDMRCGLLRHVQRRCRVFNVNDDLRAGGNVLTL